MGLYCCTSAQGILPPDVPEDACLRRPGEMQASGTHWANVQGSLVLTLYFVSIPVNLAVT